jgi:hypothetical protein
MKKISELTDFYYKTLYPSLKELEDDRKQLKHKIITLLSALLFITFVLIYGLKEYIYKDTDLLFFIGVSYVMISAIIYKFLIKDYTQEFKEKIIAPLIHEIDPQLRYSSNLHIQKRLFLRSKLFTQKPTDFSGNDFVQGKIDGIDVQFSDIHAQKEYRDSNGKKHYETIFRGLFIVSEFNKHFKGSTVVLPDSAENIFGSLVGKWLQSNNIKRDELVKMDNIKFEKEFVVYATDQIEARYILSPSLMEKLLSFKKRSKHPVLVSFVGGSIYVAIDSNDDEFEPSVFHSLLDYKIAMQYVKTLHLAVGIVEELKLNQKLWSKR